MKNILLVEPDFPLPPKSRNHKTSLPIGLLKIGTYFSKKGDHVRLVRGLSNPDEITFYPDEILITSLFTYWAPYVKSTVSYYKSLFPMARTIVGGVYASLLPEHCLQTTNCDEVYVGILEEAEDIIPDYSLLRSESEPDYQILTTTRGCRRKCQFCGTWIIEPKFDARKSIRESIFKKKLIFYDNNILLNPHIDYILEELIELKRNNKIVWCDSQCGFDGRILLQNPSLAKRLKQAGFRYPKIAWDWHYMDYMEIKEQLDILSLVGYRSSEIYVFMIYNWDIPFEEMEKKRIQCWEWKVQIADCRYHPLTQTFETYIPLKTQTPSDYYIHEKTGWTDTLVKQFRKNIRRQNICVRQRKKTYSRILERGISSLLLENEIAWNPGLISLYD